MTARSWNEGREAGKKGLLRSVLSAGNRRSMQASKVNEKRRVAAVTLCLWGVLDKQMLQVQGEREGSVSSCQRLRHGVKPRTPACVCLPNTQRERKREEDYIGSTVSTPS